MKTGYDIIIQAGQSNAQGYGYGETACPYTPSDDVLYYCDFDFERYDDINRSDSGDGFKITVAKERVVEGYTICNFSLPFASEYVKAGLLKEGRRVLIIRCAIGATSFACNHWGKNDYLFLRMLRAIDNAMRLEFGDNAHRFVALLWHQGESDTGVNASSTAYYNNLKFLVEAVREKTKTPSLPFLAGDFVQDWKNSSEGVFNGCIPIEGALRQLTNDLPYAGFVESVGLLSNRLNPTLPVIPAERSSLIHDVENDDIHFCRDAQMQLGKRYFEGLLKIKTP